MVLNLATVGLGRLARKDPDTSSSAARQHSLNNHDNTFLRYLSESSQEPDVRGDARRWLAERRELGTGVMSAKQDDKLSEDEMPLPFVRFALGSGTQ